MKLVKITTYVICLTCIFAVTAFSAVTLNDLSENQVVSGFRTVSLYENGSGNPMGARFISEKYGFIVDYLKIESVPQAFFWIKTPPSSSKGEPHACEHLLLGKGNRGRYVAALEDMALSSSTAYTAQTRTCYHFNTVGGADTFYKIFEAKLQAFLHPDFTDEEIRREVCHVGVNVDQETGELSIDEKGTVYTEMVSSFEKPWYYSYGKMNDLMYGENHPLTNNSGGHPDVMRTMEPSDMWSFHKETHQLNNMGSIVSMPSTVELESFLISMNQVLENCNTEPVPFENRFIKVQNLPPANPAEEGTAVVNTYPSDKNSDPGYIMFSYPPMLSLTSSEELLFDLFFSSFASGQTSNLYNLFINSQTRQIDIGGSYVFGSYDADLEIAPYIGFGGINSDAITLDKLAVVKKMILDELRDIQNYKKGSDELKEFNNRIKSQLTASKKQIEEYLNSPPMFGFRRGSAGGWVSLLLDVERQPGFNKSLVLKNRFAEVEKMLDSDANIWKDKIDQWKLLSVDPYSIGTVPSDKILKENKQKKEERINAYIASYKQTFNTDDDQDAIAKYKEAFDAKTAELESLAAHDDLPGFIDNPPMTLDDQLNYTSFTLNNNIPMVASTFDNMTSSKFNIALDMNVVPESLLVYLPLFPDFLTSIGVIKEGEIIPYDVMSERLKNEVLGFGAGYDIGPETGRVELVLSGKGSDIQEMQISIDWMKASLYSPYLSVDNLNRISDVINQGLLSYKNRMKSSEENWVRDPSEAYRHQNNPLYLSTNSFLTKTHQIQRMKWMFTDPGSETQQQNLQNLITELKENGQNKSREELNEFLASYESFSSSDNNESAEKIVKEITKTLKASLSDIPDANLAEDYAYLCDEIKTDLMKKPEQALAEIKSILSLITKSDNVRTYMVSNKTDRDNSMDKINDFLALLDSENKSVKQEYSTIDNVIKRIKSRENLDARPTYAGLIFDGTRNGVLIFSAKNTEEYDTSEEAMLKTLSGKLYTGYGPHGLFMKTWAAGLAYSNGYRMSERTGRATYYAERCPDVAETMRFVVKQLKEAEEDPQLADYTIAQVFGSSRAPDRYEARGEAMANDIADGLKADEVSAYRKHILDVRAKKDFYTEIKSRMEDAYGSVLIGYGKPLAESEDGNFFLIGPEEQFETLEKYIKQTEGEQPVYRLYPRDFWLTN
ncbi:MAG: hypothetical protein DWP97_05420 [Calditrichaeota bacterium]|nr:MAG: hypothetical protein DWP97_05420 [Calditrichota bacterium]